MTALIDALGDQVDRGLVAVAVLHLAGGHEPASFVERAR